jgi:Lar family restriction alleviation protein
MSELKPCPFCDGRTTVKTRYIGYGSLGLGSHDEYRVVCQECHASSDEYRHEAEAIAAWNRRANLDGCENELIVRCESCKHYNRIGCSDGFGWCERMDRGTNDDFYCSLAERSEW